MGGIKEKHYLNEAELLLAALMTIRELRTYAQSHPDEGDSGYDMMLQSADITIEELSDATRGYNNAQNGRQPEAVNAPCSIGGDQE